MHDGVRTKPLSLERAKLHFFVGKELIIMEHQYQTVSSSAKNVKTLIVVWIVMAIVAIFGLTVSLVAFIFFEVVIAISCMVMLLIVSKARWLLHFEGTTLTIINLANRRAYRLDDLKHSDFVFTQSQVQKDKNCAHLKIIGSSAVFHDVQDFEKMKFYIDQNFSK